MSFETAMAALTSDATKWADTADMLDTATSASRGMGVDAGAFTFLGAGVAAEYEQVRRYIESYLGDGSTQTDGAAAALRKVHDTYESSDDRAKQSIQSKWHWR